MEHRTEDLRRIEAEIGASARLAIHSSSFGNRPVFVVATWPCGCRADGDDFSALLLDRCGAHAPPRLRLAQAR